jgi:hypothetical protein
MKARAKHMKSVTLQTTMVQVVLSLVNMSYELELSCDYDVFVPDYSTHVLYDVIL